MPRRHRCRELAAAIGTAAVVALADVAIATLELGLGRYAQALAAIESLVDDHQPGWTCLGLAIAVEAAARAGQPDRAARYLDDLQQRATASGTDWASRATRTLPCARRRRRRRRGPVSRSDRTTRVDDDRHRTGTSPARLRGVAPAAEATDRRAGTAPNRYDAFAAMGAEGFAARARAELAATGAKVRRRVAGPVTDLTPQEAQAARLAAPGATNAEIAARMFISANTVDYHLRKVYRKLGINSRRDLARRDPAARLARSRAVSR